MIGVAMPGIAPVAPSAAPPPNAAAGRGELRTMLGVAMPGIAPTHDRAPANHAQPQHAPLAPAAIPPIVPAPPPLVQEPLPAPPVVVTKKGGLPLGIVAGVVGLLVAAAGVGVYFFWKAGPPLVVKPRLGPQGDEQLVLTCPTCPDGTTAGLLGAKGTFANKEAAIELPSPLKLGDNPLEIVLDRPGMGRDEVVKAQVSIPYRLKFDLSGLTGTPTANPIVVQVETLPGSTVKLDGHEVTLDAQGRGSQPVDVHADTEGPSDEGKIIDKSIPYEITRASDNTGRAPTERGTLATRVPVVPLHIDAPTAHMVTDAAQLTVAGRTAKNATVTVNGKTSGANGVFAAAVDLPAPGETAVEIRAAAPQVAPRTAHISVKRVASLEAEAKAFEAASRPLGYDAVSGNIDASAGQNFVVEGEVRQSRAANHQTVAIVDDKRGCAKHPCLVRVVYAGELDLKPKQQVRAYGRITRAFSTGEAGAKPVPEVEADFVLRGKAPGH